MRVLQLLFIVNLDGDSLSRHFVNAELHDGVGPCADFDAHIVVINGNLFPEWKFHTFVDGSIGFHIQIVFVRLLLSLDCGEHLLVRPLEIVSLLVLLDVGHAVQQSLIPSSSYHQILHVVIVRDRRDIDILVHLIRVGEEYLIWVLLKVVVGWRRAFQQFRKLEVV